MSTRVTVADAMANFADLLSRVVDDRETVIITRRGAADVALIAAGELSGLIETIHLLRSPKNAERLLSAIREAERGAGTPMSIDELRREVGLVDTTER